MGGVEDLINAEQWMQLTSIVKVEARRTIGQKTQSEVRYYITGV
jgi:hypothetical protein